MCFYKKYYLRLFSLILLFLCFHPRTLFAQNSIIQKIQYILPCIVEITSRNAVMFEIPGVAFIDKESGQLIQTHSIKAAEYTRQGSGVIIDPGGIIVTNAHIVMDGARIEVQFLDGARVIAQILKVVPTQDLAFLKIDPPYPLSRINIIDSVNVGINEEVITVGSSPFLKQTISEGRIIGFAKHGNSYANDRPDLFQININIYQGDSGGPLFNKKGQLIGLMVAKQADRDRACFAIPSDKIITAYLEFLNEVKQKIEHE
ncbi:MAG: S1C family serine protease [Candidatus Omnitrophota bacterium]